MKISLLTIIIFSSIVYFAQQVDFSNYKPLESKGNLPTDFTLRTSHKVEQDINNEVNNSDKKNTKKTKEAFILKSNYFIDDLLMSGNVLFGDPITKYINEIADKILKDEPELRKDLRFYCVKSNITNAFTTNQGMIFVTLGLIAQLENEAQLAFVLGHEITHYKRKHVINSILEADKIFSKNNQYNVSSQDNNIIKLSNYSKSLELESDSTGFHYVQNAGYDMDEILNTFDVLQFSYLPFDELEINFDELSFDNLEVPDYLILDSITPINFSVDENDKRSSHPNLNTRRTKIQSLLDYYDNPFKGVSVTVSATEFNKVRALSRFESIRIDLKNLNYVSAYYNILVLLKEYPSNQYLIKSQCKALYGISKLKLSDKYFNVFETADLYEGHISTAYNFFEKIDANYLALITIRKLFEENRQMDNKYIANMLNNLTTNFITQNDTETFDFETFFSKEEVDSTTLLSDHMRLDSLGNNTKKSESKYDKLKKIKSDQNFEYPEDNETEIPLVDFKNIFINYALRSEISTIFENNLLILKKKKADILNEFEEFNQLSQKQKNKTLKRALKQSKKDFSKTREIGADKIVFVDPRYYRIDERKGVKLENSEDKTYTLYNQIKEIGESTELKTEILSPKHCKVDEFEKMNHLSICNDWISEIGNLRYVQSNWDIIPSETEYMEQVSDYYKSELFAFTGVIVLKEKKLHPLLLVAGLFTPYTFPFALYTIINPQYTSVYYTYVFDTNTGEVVASKVFDLKSKATDANIQSDMYYLFSTLKSAKK